MFANYRYSAIIRRVTPSSAPEPKNDPVLIGELHGVSGLDDFQVQKGYFQNKQNLKYIQIDNDCFRSSTLTFDGNPWTGAGELIPTDIDRDYFFNGDGTYSEPDRVNGIQNSYDITNNNEGKIVDLYNIHIENINKEINKSKKYKKISITGEKLANGIDDSGRYRDNRGIIVYDSVLREDDGGADLLYKKDNSTITLLNLGTLATYDEFVNALTSKRVVLGVGNTTNEIPIAEGDRGRKLADNTNKTSLKDYTTLSYNGILQMQSTNVGEDFRKFAKKKAGGSFRILDVDGKEIDSNYTTTAKKVADIIPNSGVDFINFSVSSYESGGSVSFTAFLTSFSDNISPSWEDVKYVGRQDTLKHFVGSTRTTSVGFKVAAFNPQDIAKIYAKLNNIIKYAGVAGVDSSAYLSAPLIKLTLGKWFTSTPCVITSIKYDVQVTEYSWDIEKGLPHLVDVSLDFFILGDKGGNVLNSSTNRYI